ncbi:SusC/RagA family TonB-linked outer membrane protein [Pontibacter sp. SGAir0037]|uniref:SusC/RagA family TonB-linked outer membrane protein n=1 Tax=Pontibacter sp. SGAir0037 TaxID=2571030 RepID=UPI0010CCF8D2|nr:SusC/RagA family TonB-linked outer membrane protein [Pontibacter sp. SGAir0037]QCR22355.1 SusC/RagA family TonB-linked outer membrane protein [Pontibacter sp. SGAir0037]
MKRSVLLFSLLLCALTGMAQQPVRGKVSSAKDNTPLPGASVVIKGTDTGVTTNAEGEFTLPRVPDNSLLLVTFLGYVAREIAVELPLSQPLLIALQENEHQLQEVVVSTGYQNIPQERATGSFAQVSQERFNEQVSTDVLGRLEAVANGITVNRGTLESGNIMVRGLSTIQGPKAPLIVVDNFPYEGDINNINPNDVEQITVLKDAAAASIWGARAGNGVIVITTKQGRFNQPLRVEFNSNVTFTGKPDLSYSNQMSSADYIEVEQMLFDRGYYDYDITSPYQAPLSPVVELLLQQRNGTISAQEAEAQLSSLRQQDVRNEYSRYMYQPGLNQQYSLGLRGGSAQNAWLLSAGYDKNVDNLAASFNRLNLRFQNTLRPVNNLELTTGLYYTQSGGGSGRPAYGTGNSGNTTLYPYTRFADAQGNALPTIRDYRQAYKETAGNGQLLDWNYYPLEDYKHDRTTTALQEVLGNIGASYQLPLGLEALFRYQYQRQQTTSQNLQGEQSYAARNLVNLYTRIDPETNTVSYGIPRGAILDRGQALLEAHNVRAQLNFNHTWGLHEVAALAGGEVRHARTTGSSTRMYGFNEAILTTGLVDYVNRQPTFIDGSLALVPNRDGLSDRLNRFVSVFGNGAYTYRGRYTLSGSVRRDASNLFGVLSNDRWNPLWSSGLSWDISREPFYKLAFLPYLKLRATYGFSGNTDLSKTAVTTIQYAAVSPYTLAPYATYDNYANPDLRWETARMTNIGLDFRLKGNRVTGSLEYFRKKGIDLFGREQLESTAGIGSTIVKNVASMKGSGFDLELNSLNLQIGGWQWASHLNTSYAREEVTEYYLSNLNGSAFVGSVPTVSALPGKAVYAIYSYRWAGLDPQTGDPQGIVNEEISTDYATLTGAQTQVTDLKYHGSALPTLFGSFGNTFSFKGFSLTARFSYKLGYYFRRESLHYGNLYAIGLGHADYALRWQQPGDEAFTNVPSLLYPDNFRRDAFYSGSEALVERGDHIRFQYVTASYELTKESWKQLPFSRLQVYGSVNNLGLLWAANNKGIDPDFNLNSYAIPPAKSFSLGLRASF